MHKFLGVGINSYPGAPLSGCVHDEQQNERKLSETRYAVKDGWQGKRLLNARATKARIIDGLKWLFAGARSGDVLRFTYSGHGTEQARGGKLQHAACPVDFCFDEEHTLWAHEILEIIGNVPAGVKPLIVWDSCHAEWTQNDRRLLKIDSLIIEPRSYPLFEQPDVETENQAARNIGDDLGAVLLKAVQSGAFPCCYVAGCGAHQTSADVQDTTGAYGAATHYLWAALDASPLTLSMADVVALANQNLRAGQFEQVMQCEGSLKGMSVTELFGI